MSLVSVIMPVYNVADYLERSINSIKNQNYNYWELILVNDGSQDESGKICEKFAKHDEKITVIHQKNKGSGLARQNGLENAKGEFICFVDPDDYLEPDALKNNVQIMKKFDVDIIVNSYYELKNNKKNKCLKEKKNVSLKFFYTKEEFRNNYGKYRKVGDRTLWNKLYRSEFLIKNKIRFSDLPVGQDAEFNYKVYQKLNAIFIDPSAYYVYDRTRENSAVKSYRKNRLEIELQLINKHRKMFEDWSMYDKYEYIILLEYFNAIFMELSNLFVSSNTLSFREKAKTLEKKINTDDFEYMFENLTIEYLDSKKMKILFYLLKYNQYYIVFFIFEIISKIR